MFFVIMRKKTLEKIKKDRFEDGRLAGFRVGVDETRRELAVSREMFNKLFHENIELRKRLAKSIPMEN